MDLHISKKSKIILGLSAVSILIPIASSLFIITDSTETTTTTDIKEAVAYIEDIYFPTVSDAIIYANGNNTNDTIYVIPGEEDGEYTQSYIDRDCILESEDTLVIPYDEEENYLPGDYDKENNYFADYNQNENILDVHLKTEVIISEGTTFTNEGTIYIGGILGKSVNQSNQRPTGHVAGSYAQISMEYDSKIINKGTIYSYGFIKERLKEKPSNTTSPEIINNDGSKFYTPITIYDYFGGTYTTGASNNGAMPFHIFDFNNIQTIITFEAGSKMSCYYCLYLNILNGYNLTGELDIIGNDGEACLFGLSSGSVSFHYKGKTSSRPSDDEYTYSYSYLDFNTTSATSAPTSESDLARTYVYINKGSVLDIQHFTIETSLSDAIDTAEFFVPFSYKFIIEVMSGGTINIENDAQFLGGSHLIIDEGGTANFNAATLFYGDSTQYLYNSSLKDYYPNFLGSAECLINGMAYLNSDFGGTITTTVSNSCIIPGQDFTNMASTTQVISAENYIIYVQAETTEISYYAQAYISYSEEESYGTLRNIENSHVYNSIASSDGSDNYYFYGTAVPNSLIVTDTNGLTESTIDEDDAVNYSITLEAYLINTDDTKSPLSNDDITWKVIDDNYASIDTEGVLHVTYSGNSTSDITISIRAYYDYYVEELNDIKKEIYGTYTLTIDCCFEKGTLILTRRGNIPVENVSLKDEVLSFNHFTGKFEHKPISIIVNHGFNLYMVINLYFNDGSQFHVIGNHGLFDKTLDKYVDFSINTYKEFIGHEFVIYENNEIKIVTLVNATNENKFTECYSCFSFENLNVVANNFLSVGSDLYGFYNIFSYLTNMQYNPTEIEKDIETYGLYEYEDFKHLISKEIFDAFGVKYFKISIGKDLMTYQQLLNYIEKELNGLVDNGEAFTDFKTY